MLPAQLPGDFSAVTGLWSSAQTQGSGLLSSRMSCGWHGLAAAGGETVWEWLWDGTVEAVILVLSAVQE